MMFDGTFDSPMLVYAGILYFVGCTGIDDYKM